MPTPNSSTRFAIDIGTVVADTYRIDAQIGRGGMGAVFVASHLRLPGNKVAIKVLHTGVEDAEVMARFKREAEIAARLNHPNIVDVIDVNTTADGTPYLVLEYLRGVTLAERIAAGPLPLEQMFRIVREIGSALAAAHGQGIVHRDLKPQNVFLVSPEGENTVEVAKVLDFGISKIRGSQTVKTQETTMLGTPQYMAPEQATGKHESVDERTDIFALGAIVYEMVSGRPAFSGASIPEVVFKVVYEPTAPLPAEVPEEIARTIARAMAKPPVARFSTVDAFVESLTGTKLSRGRVTIDPPATPEQFATGSKHTVNAGGAELASTLASGDHGPAAVGTAETIDSAKLPAVIPVPAGSLTVSTLPPTSAAEVSAPSSSQVMVVANTKASSVATDSRSIWGKVLAAGGALATAAVAFLVVTNMRSGESARQPTDVGVAKTDVRGRDEPVEPSAKPHDEPAHVASIVGVDASVDATRPVTETPLVRTPAKPAVKTPVVKPPKPEGDDDSRAEPPELADARVAFKSHDGALALSLVNRIINTTERGSHERGQALLLRGRINCELKNNIEAARADLRALEGYPKLAARLRKLCDL